MEVERVNCDTHIVTVYRFHYIVSSAKLVDGAVRSAAELQGNSHISANLV
mgnify:CR=1 FL=1